MNQPRRSVFRVKVPTVYQGHLLNTGIGPVNPEWLQQVWGDTDAESMGHVTMSLIEALQMKTDRIEIQVGERMVNQFGFTVNQAVFEKLNKQQQNTFVSESKWARDYILCHFDELSEFEKFQENLNRFNGGPEAAKAYLRQAWQPPA